jgi:hypothetical protein
LLEKYEMFERCYDNCIMHNLRCRGEHPKYVLKCILKFKGKTSVMEKQVPVDFPLYLLILYRKANDDYKRGPIKHFNEAQYVKKLHAMDI